MFGLLPTEQFCFDATNVEIRKQSGKKKTKSKIIRIYHKCEDGIENRFRGSPFGITKLVE